MRPACLLALLVLVPGCSAVRAVAPDPEPTAGRVAIDLVTSDADRARLVALSAARAHDDPRAGYRVGPDDLLSVRIPDLVDAPDRAGAAASHATAEAIGEAPVWDRGLRVSSRGDLTVPFLGDVPVEGRTTGEIEADLAQRLRRADLLRKPQPSVSVIEYRSGVVAVVGSVVKPGQYPLTRPGATLADMVLAAGGPDKDAGRVVAFTPAGSGDPVRLDLERLLHPSSARDTGENPRVRPGDVVSLAPAGNVQVDGWVDKPGSYPITRGLTVTGAIAAAGGRHFAADVQHVSVKRTRGAGEQDVVVVDLHAVAEGRAPDLSLTDGDVVRLPASWARVVPWSVWSLTKDLVSIGGSVALF